MRAWAPFLVYGVALAIHLVQIAVGDPQQVIGKGLLMPALVASVLLAIASRRGLLGGGGARLGIALLIAALLLSWAGDVLLESVFLPGLGAFAAAHLVYIALFAGPARTRRPPLWSALFVLWGAVLVPVLWPHLGAMAVPLVLYAVVLAGTAVTSTGVSGLTALGGALFLASDTVLAFRLFWPGFDELIPDPWRGLAIMALYGAGQGLIAAGVLGRLAVRVSATPPVGVSASVARG